MRFTFSAILIFGFLMGSLSRAAAPQTISFSGQVLNSSDAPVLDSSVQIKVQIINSAGTCLLYEETQAVSTLSTNGLFGIEVGSNPGSSKRTANDPGRSMTEVFQNTQSVAANNGPLGSCPGGLFSPSSGEIRYMRVTMTPSSTGTAEVLSPDIVINSVPQALIADTANQLKPSADVNLNNYKITNLVSPVSSTDAVNKTYADTNLKGYPISGSPTSGQVLQFSGSDWTAVTISGGGGGGGTVTIVNATAPLSVATATTTPTISMTQATSSINGYLSSTDWTLFNSKMSNSLASGNIWVGNASNVPTPVNVSGDASLSNTGVLTLATVPLSKGGTGTTTLAANKIIATNGTGTAFQNFSCSLNQVISFDVSGIAVCQSLSTLVTPAGSFGQIQFNDSGIWGASPNLIWDNTNQRLGIGTTTPVDALNLMTAQSGGSGITVQNTMNTSSSLSQLKVINSSGGYSTSLVTTSTAFTSLPPNAGGIITNTGVTPFFIAPGGTERMRVTSAGVVIGPATGAAITGTPITGVYKIVVTTTFSTISIGATSSAFGTYSLPSGLTLAPGDTIHCAPNVDPASDMIYSSYYKWNTSNMDSIKIVVHNVGGAALTPPNNWNCTVIKF